MKNRLIVIFILLTFGTWQVFCKDSPNTVYIMDIDNIVQPVNSRIENGEYPACAIGSNSPVQTSVVFYWEPDSYRPVKIVKEQFFDNHNLYTEYFYYPDGKLAFVSEKINLKELERIQERSSYLLDDVLIRYVLTGESGITVNDHYLARWSAQTALFLDDAERYTSFFIKSLGPMLAGLSESDSDVFARLEKRYVSGERDEIFLILETESSVWEVTLDTVSNWSETSRDGNPAIIEYFFTGSAGRNYTLEILQKEQSLRASMLRWESGPYGFEKITALLSLSLESLPPVYLRKYIEPEYASVILPAHIINTDGKEIEKTVIDNLLALAEAAEYSFKDRIDINDYRDLEALSKVTVNSSQGLRARVLSSGTGDTVEVLKEVKEFTEIEGPTIVRMVFDCFSIDPGGDLRVGGFRVKTLKWVSPSKLMIIGTFPGESSTKILYSNF